MQQYTIDLTKYDLEDIKKRFGIKGMWTVFYALIVKGLDFPNWCGLNFDAIWDMMTGWMDTPAHIIVKRPKFISKELNLKYQILIETLDEAVKYFNSIDDFLSYEIID